jgi:hypothetical protein
MLQGVKNWNSSELLVQYQSIWNCHAISRSIKKNLQFYKATSKQSCSVHMFTCRVVVLPVTTSSGVCHAPSCKCHYSHNDL